MDAKESSLESSLLPQLSDFGSRFKKLVNSCQGVIGIFTEVAPPDSNSFILTSTLQVDLSVYSKTALLPTIHMSKGFFIALDDLLLACCCKPAFFVEPTVDGENIAIHYLENPALKSHSYYDYQCKLNTRGVPFSEKLYRQTPSQFWRLQQASLLSNLSAQWAMLHEVSHWLMGHTLLIKETTFTETLGLVNFNTQSNPVFEQPKYRQCLELQADGLAFELMFYEVMGQSGPNYLWQNFLESQDQRTLLPYEISGQEPEQRLRMLLLASGAVILLFEHARKVNKLSLAEDYPKPLTRLINLFSTALRLVCSMLGILKSESTAKQYEFKIDNELFFTYQDQVNQMFTGITLGLSDVALLATELGVSQSLYEDKTVDIQDIQQRTSEVIFLQQLFLDMTAQSLTGNSKGENIQALAEFKELLPFQVELFQKLRNYSLIEI